MTDRALDRTLSIRLLGDLALGRGAEPIALPASRRTRALLGYLVATGAPHQRSALCDLLWEGPDDPRASLRWSLTKLRAIVDGAGAQRLLADRERVAFDATRCDIDIVAVRRLLTGGIDAAPLAALEAAAERLHGEFLDGLDLPACYRFHHWCMAERERYGELRRGVLAALVARLASEPERALPYGRAMVAADPLTEAAHAALVGLLAGVGRYPEAERHYAWARELLRRELALPAGGPLDLAIQRARRAQRDGGGAGTVATPAAALAATEPPPPAAESVAAPLHGRAAERAAIGQAVSRHGSGRVLLFTGEPGIGKTRLLDHLADCAVAAGRRVLRGRCFEAERVRPYGLWLDTLRGACPADPTGALLAVDSTGEGGNRERLFDAAARTVRGLAVEQPLALVLDDLQWIDEGSAALLHFLARTLATDANTVLAAAARAGEIDDNPWAKGLLHSLTRADRLQQIELAPIGAAEVRALLGDLPIDAADIVRQSGGNPLYVIEFARAARRGDDATGRTLDALIDERLRALDDAAHDLLGWAAAMGGELQAAPLAAAAGLTVAEALTRLGRLVRRGLLVENSSGNFDFAHDLVRAAVYRALSQPRRRAIHRQIAQAFAAASADDPWLHGEIVHHAGLAGDVLVAARACLAAGEHCLRVYANVQAIAVAERGLAYVEALDPGAESVRLEIGLLRLRVAAVANPGGRRLPALSARIERAVEAAEALGLHAEASAAWEILAFWNQQASDRGRAQEATLAAERLARQADTTTRCLQLANSGRCLLDIEADPVRGRALLEEATALAIELDLKVMEIDWGRGLIARSEGDLERASAHIARAVTLARLAGNHWREVECAVWLATVEYERGRYDAVLQQVDAIVAAAARMGEPRAPFAEALHALARWYQGDPGAEALFEASLQALRELDDKAHLAYALNEAAAIALATGRREVATTCASEALTAAQAVRRPSEIAVAVARLACAAPDAERATAWLAQRPAGAAPNARAAVALAAAARAVSTLAPTAAP